MKKPHLPITSPDPLPVEAECRRSAWAPGQAVRLADGVEWSLSCIDIRNLILDSRLLAGISLVLDLSDAIRIAEVDVTQQTIATAEYHSHLAQLGLILLQRNYVLPDDDWRRLLGFDRLASTLRLTQIVSEVIADSVGTWMPLYLTSGVAGQDNLLLN